MSSNDSDNANGNSEIIDATDDTRNEDIDINNSQRTVTITSLCHQCSVATSKKSNTLECYKCHGLVHYECSKLPSYAIHSYKNSHRKYVCEICSPVPNDQSYVVKETTAKEIVISDYEIMIKDIYLWMKETSDFDKKKLIFRYSPR